MDVRVEDEVLRTQRRVSLLPADNRHGICIYGDRRVIAERLLLIVEDVEGDIAVKVLRHGGPDVEQLRREDGRAGLSERERRRVGCHPEAGQRDVDAISRRAKRLYTL